MTHTSVLHRLQSVDSEMDARLARLEEIEALLGQNEEVRAARHRLDTAEEERQAIQARVSDLELEIAALERKTGNTSDRLYSGAVTNPKELQDMEQELHSLNRRREALEESLLEALVALEEKEAAVAQARSDMQAVEEKWAASQGDLAQEKQGLEARVAELQAAREGVVAQVDAESLGTYEALRARLGGLAVAKVKDGVCSACGVAPTSSVAQKARHGDLDARCPTCGRILYAG